MQGQLGFQVQVPLNATLALRNDISIVPQQLGQEPCYVIEDPIRGKFYRIGVREFTLVSLLDGRTSLGSAMGLAASVLGPEALTEQDALALGSWLIDCQLAQLHNAPTPFGEKRPTGGYALLRNPLFIKLPLANPDLLLQRMLPWCRGLLSPWFFVCWALLCGVGIYHACTHWDRLVASSAVILDPANWLRMTAAWFCLSLWHETFHALACKKYGGSVPRAGVALLFFMPAAFVDVTSSWRFRSKRQRSITAAAGIYAELMVAAAALIVWAHSSDGVLHRFCYDLAFMASLATLLVNGNPLLRFDGYYILSDLVEIPNLATRARDYVGYLCRRYLGGSKEIPPACPPGREAFFCVYAVAAAIWRVLLCLTLMLTAIGMFSYLGMIAVALFITLRIVLPTARLAAKTVRAGLPPGRSLRQWAVCGGCAAGLFAGVGWWLASPGTVRARAIVEYAPLNVVRAASPGFVNRILVRDGEQVKAGQVLVILTNDELHVKLADLELSAQQALLRGRSYYQDKDLPKYQIETFEFQSLDKKRIEAEQEVASLTIRSPVDGHVVGRKLATLEGQYLEAGTEIAVIGNEEAKELVVAVPQDDVDPFTSHVGRSVGVRVWGGRDEVFNSVLSKVDPRAVVDCPHPGLSAEAGGPMPVKARTPAENDADQTTRWQLLTPIFTGQVLLSPSQSAGLHSGQLSTVSFQSAMESRWRRLNRWASHWVERQIEHAQSD
jgi:putative peptide zinc metalloprotease protein